MTVPLFSVIVVTFGIGFCFGWFGLWACQKRVERFANQYL